MGKGKEWGTFVDKPHPRRSFSGRIAFCPACSCRTLAPSPLTTGNGLLEYDCTLCGFSFRISPSRVWQTLVANGNVHARASTYVARDSNHS